MKTIGKILQSIKNSGGTPLFVGGCIRDQILGIAPKDFDIEIYNLDAKTLGAILAQFGKVSMVGSFFGIIKLTTPDGLDFDFSLPRRENKTGKGHKGFMVEVDPTMTPQEGSARRDFTFNSLVQDPFTGEIKDFFGGIEDLKNKTLKNTSEAFSEDPLRVLRGMQFCGRFDLSADKNTLGLCERLSFEFFSLPKERVFGEFWKWATKSVKPSKGLIFLKESGWIWLFPEIAFMVGLPQDKEWHPEGDVFTHTCHVCDAAVEIADRENLSEDERGALVLAALCHDMGKATTTIFEDGHWKSPTHDKVGGEMAREFLMSLNPPQWLVNKVSELVSEHMVHVNGKPSQRQIRRFLSRLEATSPKEIVMLIEADHSGRPPLPKGLPEEAKCFLEMSAEMGDKIEPILMGRHLIEMGFKPGPEMGKVLKGAFEAQLDGEFFTVEEAKNWIVRSMEKK